MINVDRIASSSPEYKQLFQSMAVALYTKGEAGNVEYAKQLLLDTSSGTEPTITIKSLDVLRESAEAKAIQRGLSIFVYGGRPLEVGEIVLGCELTTFNLRSIYGYKPDVIYDPNSRIMRSLQMFLNHRTSQVHTRVVSVEDYLRGLKQEPNVKLSTDPNKGILVPPVIMSHLSKILIRAPRDQISVSRRNV